MPKTALTILASLAFASLALASSAQAATITVTTGADSGPGSLRAAIASASPGATIVIPSGTSVSLTSGQLTINQDLTIQGGGARTTSVSAGGLSRVFLVNNGSVTISGLTITGGNSGGGSNDGGGIDAVGNALTLIDSTVTGNTAPGRVGSGIDASGSALTVVRSTISDNSGGGEGGGIAFSAASQPAGLSIVNSTISGNSASSRGGGLDINVGDTPVSLVNDTVAGNSTLPNGNGGGIGFENGVPGAITLVNTIVADNTSRPSAANCLFPANATSLGHNLENTTPDECGFTNSTDLVGVEPGLGLLRNNGGPTDTMSITHTSRAFAAASNTACPATDQRGFARPQVATCDIGAYEWAQADLGVLNAVNPPQAQVNQRVTFTITVHNAGPDVEPAAALSDTLPSAFAVQSVTPSQGSCGGSPAVTCSLGSLAPGATAHVTLTVRSARPGSYTITAHVTGAQGDLTPADDTAATGVEVVAGRPALSHLTLTPQAFRAAGSGASIARQRTGSTVTYRDSTTASTVFTIQARKTGHIAHGKCIATRGHLGKRAKPCTRYVTLGAFTHNDRAGANRFHFTGRLAGRKLPRGAYRFAAFGRNIAGAGRVAYASFRITA